MAKGKPAKSKFKPATKDKDKEIPAEDPMSPANKN